MGSLKYEVDKDGNKFVSKVSDESGPKKKKAPAKKKKAPAKKGKK